MREELDRLKTTSEVARFRALESAYDRLRKQLVTQHKADLAAQRNEPMSAPGILVSWTAKPMPAMEARTDYLITFSRLVAAK